jgi:polysaccharide biosynthesis transport protein
MTNDPATQTPAVSGTPLAGLLSELWRYKLLIPAVAILVAGATTFWVVRRPKVYEATVNLEYDPNPSKPLGNGFGGESTTYRFWDMQEFYETQNFILRSRSLAERVVRKLGLERDPDYMPPNPASTQLPTAEQAAGKLLAAIDVQQVRDTRIVTVHVRDSNPARAQLLANTLVDTYLEKALEDRVGNSVTALEWLQAQMLNIKKELESAEHELYRFREHHDSLSASLEERRKLIAGQLESYSDALTELNARRVAIDARLAVLREALAKDADDLLAIRVGPLGTDPVLIDLRARYREELRELQRLTITYGEAHPQVRAVSGNVDALRTQLAAQVQAVVKSVEAERAELDKAEAGLQAALRQVNQAGLLLSLQEVEYTRLDRERFTKAELYNTLLTRSAETDLSRALRVASARIVDRAVKPVTPVSPRVQFTIIVGVLAGLVLGVVAAYVAGRLDNKVRSPSELEAHGLTVIGVLPGISPGSGPKPRRATRAGSLENAERDLTVHHQPKSAMAECCRTLRTNITFQSADKPLRTLAITSAMPREGKTTVAISLATIIAQSGRRVLLVDTDLRRPRMHRAFKAPTTVGITSVLAGEATLAEAAIVTQVPDLSLLPCGPLPPNPSELLHTQRFAQLVAEMSSTYDVVVFDTPPVGAVTDPAIIATLVDGVVLVTRSRSTTRQNLQGALRQLRSVSARIIGGVLNGALASDTEYSQYHGYYQGYYAEEAPAGRGQS